MRRQEAPRTVVITGATSGIGEATAYAFARQGARLVLAARDGDALDPIVRRCRSLGARDALAVPTDVTSIDSVMELAARARAIGRGIDVWFSNAGVGAVGAFHETPMAAHQQVIQTNLVGHMHDAYAALPIFLRQGHGIFINMISLGAFAPAPFATAYSASKYGLSGFSAALRGELRGHPDIHICDVYPSFIDTPGLSHSANYVGRALTAPPPVYDARRVARAVVRLADRPRPTTVVGSFAHLARLGHALAPELGTRLLAMIIEAYFRRAERVPVTDGNLFAPPRKPGGIDGGLRSPTARYTAVLAAALVAGAAAGLLLGGRRSHHAGADRSR
ncbi:MULTISPECIES: SDR family oxidoreductase [unclassified Chelatococcus]|uniref:SDR family oxidoreductase n=1 Tax=unclassified Chelatococcus TaxID=2638111 RepID=UPI0002F2ADA7|nr:MULTISPECIES: SDR family oxidoreductase [unclassified Chelatococcus]ALA20378.1 short-chain dehydrogenase [Chelatococcus sp. CO-6]